MGFVDNMVSNIVVFVEERCGLLRLEYIREVMCCYKIGLEGGGVGM